MRDYYEELVERLRDSADWADHFAVLMGRADGDVHAPIMREAAEAIEDLTAALTASNEVIAKSRPKWISVEERLPEDDKLILCYLKNGKMMVCYHHNNWGVGAWDTWTRENNHFDVIAWMPLPEPPKEVGEE